MNHHLDHYCERIDIGLWGEPFNVISNIGFFIIFFLLFKKYDHNVNVHDSKIRNKKVTYFDIRLLIILLLFIGLGSTFWHVQATPLSLWADRIPILLFINIYIISCLFRILRCKLQNIIIVFTLFHVIGAVLMLTFPLESLNRSLFYLPPWFFLAAITSIVYVKNGNAKNDLLITLTLFSVAIIFRSIDIFACDSMPMGTHFLWHILISLTLYFSVITLMSEHCFNKNSI